MIYLNLIMTRGLKSLTYISSSFFFPLFYKLLITIGLVNIFDQKNMRLYIDRSFKFRKFNTLLFASMRYNLWCNLINIRPVKPLLHGKLRLNSLSYSRHVHKAILELWCVLSTFLSTFYLFTCFLSCTFILT